jgi:ubiquinone/menaquinone biosynthesis C-methylase UbiE
MNKIKRIIIAICPPLFLKGFYKLKRIISARPVSQKEKLVLNPDKQDLDLYWDPVMAELLETWGEDHAWNEIQMLLVGKKGKVLDIACGTGITIDIVSKNKDLKVYGCDISDFLIQKAINKGINKELLEVCDATNMICYDDNSFDSSYSIGSLEHFTEKGIVKFVEEIYRITDNFSFHMVPISRNGIDNGWISPYQSYFNNSEEWWLEKFKSKFKNVQSINSGWNDDASIGKWFICSKK